MIVGSVPVRNKKTEWERVRILAGERVSKQLGALFQHCFDSLHNLKQLLIHERLADNL